MKSIIKSFMTALIVTSFFASCSSDDTPAPNPPPTLSITTSSYDVDFYDDGETNPPTVNWNGDTGFFTISPAIEGISVNTNTGVIEWETTLPLGVVTVDLTATNSAGSSSVSIAINNVFSGTYDGGYNSNINSTDLTNNFAVVYETDGNMQVYNGGLGGTQSTDGSWTREGTLVTGIYSYNNGSSWLTIALDLTYNTTEAYVSGLWGFGQDISSPSGYVRMDKIEN